MSKVCTNNIPIDVQEDMRDVMRTIDRSDRKQLILNYLAMHTELVSKCFICLCECVCMRAMFLFYKFADDLMTFNI